MEPWRQLCGTERPSVLSRPPEALSPATRVLCRPPEVLSPPTRVLSRPFELLPAVTCSRSRSRSQEHIFRNMCLARPQSSQACMIVCSAGPVILSLDRGLAGMANGPLSRVRQHQDSKREESRAHFFSELTVLPALLGLSILQHSLCIRSAALYMRGGKGVRNTNINSDGLPEPSNEQVCPLAVLPSAALPSPAATTGAASGTAGPPPRLWPDSEPCSATTSGTQCRWR